MVNSVFILFSPIIVLIIIGSLSYYLARDKKSLYVRIFRSGSFGWLGAFILHFILFLLLIILFVNILGGDITDPESAGNIGAEPLVTIWQPLLAAIFHTGIMYLIYLRFEEIQEEYIESVITFGLGWAAGELIIQSFFGSLGYLIAGTEVSIETIIQNFMTRISAVLLYVGLAIMIFFALFEGDLPEKTSLFFAGIIHFLVKAIPIVLPEFFPTNYNPGYYPFDQFYLAVLESVNFVVSLGVFLYVWFIYRPRMETQLNEERMGDQPDTGRGPPQQGQQPDSTQNVDLEIMDRE